MNTNREINRPKIEKDVQKIALDICTEMIANYNMNILTVLGWVLHKIFK